MDFDLNLIANFGLLVATLIFLVVAIELKDLVKSSIALGISSALLAGVFYLQNAPFAAVFELSVCAGLVTILLLSAIGMLEKQEEPQ
jgi:NADH-quinone oxidoreductase subunit J